MNRNEFRKYNATPIWVTKAGFVDIDPYCNGWVAINKGTGICTVNGVPLNPAPIATLSGETTGASGNEGEIFVGSIQVKFAPVADTNLLLIVQKFFVE